MVTSLFLKKRYPYLESCHLSSTGERNHLGCARRVGGASDAERGHAQRPQPAAVAPDEERVEHGVEQHALGWRGAVEGRWRVVLCLARAPPRSVAVVTASCAARAALARREVSQSDDRCRRGGVRERTTAARRRATHLQR